MKLLHRSKNCISSEIGRYDYIDVIFVGWIYTKFPGGGIWINSWYLINTSLLVKHVNRTNAILQEELDPSSIENEGQVASKNDLMTLEEKIE